MMMLTLLRLLENLLGIEVRGATLVMLTLLDMMKLVVCRRVFRWDVLIRQRCQKRGHAALWYDAVMLTLLHLLGINMRGATVVAMVKLRVSRRVFRRDVLIRQRCQKCRYAVLWHAAVMLTLLSLLGIEVRGNMVKLRVCRRV
jgi:hypothetical protein